MNGMQTRPAAPLTEHPLALGSFRSWLRLLRLSGGIDPAFAARLAFVSLVTLSSSPLRALERLRYGRLVAETPIHPEPVFIIGHWRSGTTHLHNLLCQDGSLGYVSTFQGLAPGFCLLGRGWLDALMDRWARRTHPTRLIDNIPLAFDAPQEEEFAIANSSPCSSLHVFTLPRRAAYFFERYALQQGLSAAEGAEWRRVYLDILKKATLLSGGGRTAPKRLALKNPANTGRIPALLELFPNARFIHITRNPYKVFLSTRYVYRTILPRAQVQRIDPEQVEANILRFYRQLVGKYLADRSLIPAANLVELRFEDLEADPLTELRRIYQRLELGDFAQVETALRAYLASIRGYQKNRYELSDELVEKINCEWGFAFEEWGYSQAREGSRIGD
ncbi:MAG: sulfotransferase [Anaerolineales bacterium]|nr:sulfotransferase [Anaerolineales bacterium]